MGRRGRTGGGRLHNGGEENKAWKAWRLPGAASALPDTHQPPKPAEGEPKHHHAVQPFPLLVYSRQLISPCLANSKISLASSETIDKRGGTCLMGGRGAGGAGAGRPH